MNKKNIALGVALVALVIAIGGYYFPQVSQVVQKPLGALLGPGGETNYSTVGVSVIKLGSNCNDSFSSATCISFSAASTTMVAGTSTAFILNDSGQTLYVTDAQVVTTGTASSTFRIDIATTSAQTFTANNNLTAPSFAGILKNFTFATSSLATTTRLTLNALGGGPRNDNGSALIPWANNTYVGIILTAVDKAGCPAAASGACEAATSTARGFDVKLKILFNN